MRSYGQYCPIARAAEILGQRWNPIILRNLLLGSTTFGEIADAAPGIPRSLLTSRLRELERVGVVETRPNPAGHGSLYGLTQAGRDLDKVMLAMGTWGEEWMELAPEHVDPGVVLNSWCTWYLAREHLPDRRVLVRFDFPDRTRKANQLWILFDGDRSEVCRTFPGFEEELIVTSESLALSEWHLGRLEWTDALHAGRIRVEGPRALAKALPTWNRRSGWARMDIRRSGGAPGRGGASRGSEFRGSASDG
jgi:DNA-binding HxlR family transcriptional regulator